MIAVLFLKFACAFVAGMYARRWARRSTTGRVVVDAINAAAVGGLLAVAVIIAQSYRFVHH